ncbi:MAG: M1 family metallopeptidase, partial [Saprospiraceae bacterium]|nr:M1 family metallopeptidase [Saprospiraceae bacterium]
MKVPFFILFLLSLFFSIQIFAQADRWQQRASYQMEIDFDVTKHQYQGKQKLVYINNSPDTLHKVFYHLYLNAFQPGSAMDVRSRTIADPDYRVGSRILHFKPNEIGYEKIKSLEQNGSSVKYEVEGTILEVSLNQPILPNTSTIFEMEWDAQIPVQIRRMGRDNAEGIAYSMAQWYPKMCEYDYQGWHANPYIGREFYGIWGDFDVKITIDKKFTIGGTGYLQNPEEIGHGYTDKPVNAKGDKLTWHFIAPDVHDFMWAADPDYTHDKLVRDDGLVLHFFYQKNKRTEANWAALPKVMDKAFDYLNKTYGQYPYKQFSFVQGGDGGMEYPMSTLVTGERGLGSIIGTSIHEMVHSWYQGVLGTNESLYAWMDEGFTEFVEEETKNYLRITGALNEKVIDEPYRATYEGYRQIALSGIEEPLSTHADHFYTNTAYGIAAYNKGAVFLNQLQYIVGKAHFQKSMKRYFDTWKFKHPNANDFIRIFEMESGLELDWYKEYFVYTTRGIDYGVQSVEANGNDTKIILENNSLMPMPIDVLVTYKDGSSELFNIALDI